jgi:hypothetical protein
MVEEIASLVPEWRLGPVIEETPCFALQAYIIIVLPTITLVDRSASRERERERERERGD